MSFEPAEIYWIEDAETFAILGDSNRLELLELLYEPRSVTEIAEVLGVPRTRLYHHIKILEAAGMVKVVDTRKAGALTEKIYRVAARTYRPSQAFLDSSAPRQQAEAILSAILGATRADFVRSVDEGLTTLTDNEEERHVGLSRAFLKLTPVRLHEFINEMHAVFESYRHDDEDDTTIRVAVLSVIYPTSRHL